MLVAFDKKLNIKFGAKIRNIFKLTNKTKKGTLKDSFLILVLSTINICRSLLRFCGQGDRRGPSCAAAGGDGTSDRRTLCRGLP